MVDVRNVAQAHLNAVLKPEAAGKRFVLADRTYWMKEVISILHENFGDKFPKCTKPNSYFNKSTVQFASLFKKSLRPMLEKWDKDMTYVNDETKDILGIEFIPQSQTLVDMVPTLIENG